MFLQLPIVSIRISIKTINYITDIDECASSPCENGGTVLKESIYIIVHVNQVIQDNSVKWVSLYICQVL